MTPWMNKSVALMILGIVLIVLGSTLCFIWPIFFRHMFEQELILSPNSKSFEVWKDTNDIPMNIDFYFFNWTNPEEIKVPGKKPVLVQVGPYRFIEKREKINVTFHPENSTVSYFQRRFWYFDEKKSQGTLQDRITQLNVVAVSAVRKVRYWSYFMKTTLSLVLNKLSNLHVVKTVDELLFSGYEDSLINMGKLTATDEDLPPFDRFGWFYMRNGSVLVDGHFNVATGQDDIKNIGILKFWNHKDTTKFYKSPCNAIEGSAGEFWSPNRNKDDISLFSADLCRSITYEYVRTISHQGIEGYQYAIGEKTFGNNTKRRYPHEQAKYFEPTTTTEDFFETEHSNEITDNPNTEDPDVVNIGQCFCNGECSPSGVINVTACRYGAPGFVSLPHFYKADQFFRDQVTGMMPNEEDHSFYIVLEPTTGIPIDVAARLQINILLQPSKSISLFKDVPKIYFPMFWFNLRGGTTDEMARSLRQVLLLPSIGFYAGTVMVFLGFLVLLGVAILHCVRRKQRSTTASKPNRTAASPERKIELMYVDRTNAKDEAHVRNNRQLYPKL